MTAQQKWKPSKSTVLLPDEMYLADERERLWDGLERIANCGDDLIQFRQLDLGFPTFSPIEVYRCSCWDPACHRLFLFYRDTLRALWRSGEGIRARKVRHSVDHSRVIRGALLTGACEYLIGSSDLNEQAFKEARNGSKHNRMVPSELVQAAKTILNEFPSARLGGSNTMGMLWKHGSFVPVLLNDFQKAFYLLFLQSWRARICERCRRFFIARKPGRRFCGTDCSGGSRLASKRKWWHVKGAINRKKKSQTDKLLRENRGKK